MFSALRLRRLLLAGLILLAAAALSCCAALGPLASGHLDIEAGELQSRIAARFPLNYCKTPLLCVALSNPLLTLREGDDRIALTVDVKLTLGTRERAGRLGLAGRPRFDAGQGQLFLDELEITTLELADLPPDYAEWIKTAATVAARRALLAHPVYTLKDDTVKEALARRTVSGIRVVDGKLRVLLAGAVQ